MRSGTILGVVKYREGSFFTAPDGARLLGRWQYTAGPGEAGGSVVLRVGTDTYNSMFGGALDVDNLGLPRTFTGGGGTDLDVQGGRELRIIHEGDNLVCEVVFVQSGTLAGRVTNIQGDVNGISVGMEVEGEWSYDNRFRSLIVVRIAGQEFARALMVNLQVDSLGMPTLLSGLEPSPLLYAPSGAHLGMRGPGTLVLAPEYPSINVITAMVQFSAAAPPTPPDPTGTLSAPTILRVMPV